MTQHGPLDSVPSTSLIPPRPNPGPEPWNDADGTPPWPWLALLSAIILTWAVRRRRLHRTIAPAVDSRPEAMTPDARLLILCNQIRSALAAKLGPSLHARTTEEISTDPRVIEMMGAELPRLVEILAAGDRLKFARRSLLELVDRLPAWTNWTDSRFPG